VTAADRRHYCRVRWMDMWRPRRNGFGRTMRLPGYRVTVFLRLRGMKERSQVVVTHRYSGQKLFSRHQYATMEAAQASAFGWLMQMVAWVAEVKAKYKREGTIGQPQHRAGGHRAWRPEPSMTAAERTRRCRARVRAAVTRHRARAPRAAASRQQPARPVAPVAWSGGRQGRRGGHAARDGRPPGRGAAWRGCRATPAGGLPRAPTSRAGRSAGSRALGSTGSPSRG
jgi:hypothetical protein